MKKFLKKDLGGFTIIEVLIVLAIAGLIMSIVFVAVPQLERNARDTKRQGIANRVATEVQTFATNSNGQYPWFNAADTNAFKNNYLANIDMTDPKTGGQYTANIGITTTPSPTYAATNLWVEGGAKCSGQGITTNSGGGVSARDFAVLIALERNGTFYCVDNGS